MHPVHFDADYEIERNRLTTFFRLIIAIPWIIWLYIYGIVALVAAFFAWFALLFTKRYPESLYKFVAGYIELSGKVAGFTVLATDELPPFMPTGEDDYPVHITVAPRQAEYRRSRTFFKLLLVFPQQVLAYGLAFIIQGAAMITWFRVLVTGKQSATMHDAIRVSLAYVVRSHAFLLMLTETHPRLLDLPPQEIPAGAPSLPGPEQAPEGGSLTPGGETAPARI
jgi:hypothetical protein